MVLAMKKVIVLLQGMFVFSPDIAPFRVLNFGYCSINLWNRVVVSTLLAFVLLSSPQLRTMILVRQWKEDGKHAKLLMWMPSDSAPNLASQRVRLWNLTHLMQIPLDFEEP
jgi:hypothetical protein